MEIIFIGILFMIGVYVAPFVIGAVLLVCSIVVALIASLFGRKR